MNSGEPFVALCRDCLVRSEVLTPRCAACGSPRVLSMSAAAGLTLAHVDCDAFYASVEKRDRPELADKPLIIGGAGRRGVVSTACYLARTRGVRSAMPMTQALTLCPEAVVLSPDMSKYANVARDIRAMLAELTPLVEPLSIDEAYLDLAGCEAAIGMPTVVALAELARRVERDIGVTISVGLSYCKFLAKLASDLDKPRGFTTIGREEAMARLAPFGIGRLWGVGKVAEDRLQRVGLRTVGDLQRLDEAQAVARIGDDGRRLWRLARGVDERKVKSEREAKSVSAETTFEEDISDRAELLRILLRLSEKLSSRLRKANLAAGGVTLKLRTPNFRLRTRTRSGLPPTQLATRLFASARELLEAQPPGEEYRLIGIGAADLRPGASADEATLLDGGLAREKARESAIDALREKFGAGAVQRGLTFRPDPAGRR